MSSPAFSPHDDVVHSEAFLRSLMRRQLRLSVACALAFLVGLVGLPLANFFAPEFMAMRVGGFTLTWLLLGVLFFPFVWVIAFAFIRRSSALEVDEITAVRAASTDISADTKASKASGETSETGRNICL